MQAISAAERGEEEKAKTNEKFSIGCSVGGILASVLAVIIVIIAAVASSVSAANRVRSSFNDFNNNFFG